MPLNAVEQHSHLSPLRALALALAKSRASAAWQRTGPNAAMARSSAGHFARSADPRGDAGKSRPVYLVGGHITPFVGKGSVYYKKDGKVLKDYLTDAIQGAFSDTGVKAEAIDRIYVGNFGGEMFNSQGHLGAGAAGIDPGLINKPSMRIESACASGGLACSEAVRAIKAGDDAVLAVGVELQTGADPKISGTYLARGADYDRQSDMDNFTFPCLFGRRAKAYLDKYSDVSLTDISAVAVKAYENANRNPLAHMHTKQMTLKRAERAPTFLTNPEYKPYLRMTDCSQNSDGGAAAIFMSEEGLKKHGIPLSQAVKVVDTDQGAGDLWQDPEDKTVLHTAKAVVNRMMDRAGVTPADLEVVEVHDCFAVTELLMYEAIGLAEPGKAVELFKSGATSFGGKVPVNSGGGLIAYGHPIGATGVKQVMEIWRQMKGKCGDYQIEKIPNLGLTVNMGGDDKTIATMLLQNVQ